MPEHLADARPKLSLVADGVVCCKVGGAEKVDEGGVAGGVVDRVDAVVALLEDQLHVGSVLGGEGRCCSTTSVPLVLRFFLCRHVQLCDAGKGVRVTQVFNCFRQVPKDIRINEK